MNENNQREHLALSRGKMLRKDKGMEYKLLKGKGGKRKSFFFFNHKLTVMS